MRTVSSDAGELAEGRTAAVAAATARINSPKLMLLQKLPTDPSSLGAVPCGAPLKSE